jgi:hypothetical protein
MKPKHTKSQILALVNEIDAIADSVLPEKYEFKLGKNHNDLSFLMRKVKIYESSAYRRICEEMLVGDLNSAYERAKLNKEMLEETINEGYAELFESYSFGTKESEVA